MSKRPLCPGNPEDYVWVLSSEGDHWRRKRGTVTSAVLNGAYKEASLNTKIASPAAKTVRHALEPYLNGITTGRLNNRICNAFRKSLKENKRLSLSYLIGIEMQKNFPLDDMLVCDYRVVVNNSKVQIVIPIKRGAVRRFNSLASDYYFEAVVLFGDVTKDEGLKTESAVSALISCIMEPDSVCTLELSIPQQEDWCLLLKISTLEGNEMAAHTKHYRMKVVAGRDNYKEAVRS